MRQAVWTGSINFGLVTIPVRLYPATEPKDVRFHLYDQRTGRRVRYERVIREEEPAAFAPELGEGETRREEPDEDRTRAEPPRDARTAESGARSYDSEPDEPPVVRRTVDAGDIVRGLELPSGDLVTVSDEELESIAPERSHTIDIEEFVDLAEIDPVFFEKSYYVAPLRRVGAEKPYVLLLRAMQAAQMVGIGRFVLRTKPHLVAIRPLENTLGLETLYFGDEVRSPEEIATDVRGLVVSDRELKTAQQLIGALATDWIPEKHADQYREELLELLRSKPAAAPAAEGEAAPEPIADLMAALKASVEAAKRRNESAKGSRSKRVG
jgi:DNA end-binding protein Ku